MGRALLVVPSLGFSVTQYRRVRELLEKEGFQAQVAAPRSGEIRLTGFSLKPDLELGQAKAGDYDLVIFIAGRGNRELWNSQEAHRVVREAVATGKVIGASGAAVAILANAGVLQGRRATGPLSLAVVLKDKGAQYTAESVAADEGIVTLRHSEGFDSFARELLQRVRGREEVRKAA